MRRASLVTAVVGLAVSLLVSVVAWVYFDSLLLFLFVPFVPFLFRRGRSDRSDTDEAGRRCPECGFQTRDEEYDFCPRDGTRLVPADGQW